MFNDCVPFPSTLVNLLSNTFLVDVSIAFEPLSASKFGITD